MWTVFYPVCKITEKFLNGVVMQLHMIYCCLSWNLLCILICIWQCYFFVFVKYLYSLWKNLFYHTIWSQQRNLCHFSLPNRSFSLIFFFFWMIFLKFYNRILFTFFILNLETFRHKIVYLNFSKIKLHVNTCSQKTLQKLF